MKKTDNKQQENNALMRSQDLWPNSQQGTDALIVKYGELKQFIQKFNPDYQREIYRDEDECFFGDYPTCAKLKAVYGSNAAIMWLIPQLYNLSEFCGCKDKMTSSQLEECAFLITSEFYYLKISELMLFFSWFKAGRYGKFYGAVDPITIICELREFIFERNTAIDRHEKKQHTKEMAESRKSAISWDDYCMKTYGEVREFPSVRLGK